MRQFFFLFLLVALVGCSHRSPVERRQGWILVESRVRANALGGVVMDPHGEPMRNVLVQVLTPDKQFRTASCKTHEQGRFHFSSRSRGTYLLRFSALGFNDVDLVVTISRHAEALRVTLPISN